VQAQVTWLGHPVSGSLMLQDLKKWARRLKRDVHAIYLAARSPRVPWHAKIVAIAVAGYALSPVDLIPDFIPVLGYVDDLIIVPLGIWLVLSLIPEEVMAEYRAIADEAATRPQARLAAMMIIAIWILGTAMLGWIGFAHWARPN
jgi:uncharacterized membrane protein YkvA (DUF1232 family)